MRVPEVGEAGGSELGIALILAQFREDFGARALGALLLRNGIVCAIEAGRDAILAGLVSFANALDLAAMAAMVTGG